MIETIFSPFNYKEYIVWKYGEPTKIVAGGGGDREWDNSIYFYNDSVGFPHAGLAWVLNPALIIGIKPRSVALFCHFISITTTQHNTAYFTLKIITYLLNFIFSVILQVVLALLCGRIYSKWLHVLYCSFCLHPRTEPTSMAFKHHKICENQQ